MGWSAGKVSSLQGMVCYSRRPPVKWLLIAVQQTLRLDRLCQGERSVRAEGDFVGYLEAGDSSPLGSHESPQVRLRWLPLTWPVRYHSGLCPSFVCRTRMDAQVRIPFPY